MSTHTTYAVTGSTGVGGFVIDNLLEAGKTVIVLSRRSSTTVQGATTRVVDYSQPSTLEEALTGVDVVISAIGMEGMGLQPILAEAAKKVGVKLFVPCEFGNPTHGIKEGPLVGKAQLQAKLRELELPFVLTYTGPFPEFCLVAPFGFDFKGGNVRFVGAGEMPIGFTTRKDIGYYLARYLVETPDEELAWSTLRVEGDRKSFNEIVKQYETNVRPGAKVEVTRVPVEEAEAFLKTPEAQSMAGFFTYLLTAWNAGETPYNDGEIQSAKWTDYKPETVEDVLRSFE